MDWHEWPLALFTVIAQAAIGAFWWCYIALLSNMLPIPEPISRLESYMLTIWMMMALAFVISSFHLGKPMRAICASFRFGRSSLSNEVVYGSTFLFLGIIAWLMGMGDIGSFNNRLIVLGLACACSLAFLKNMIIFYMIPTVPTWHTLLTPANYLLSVITGGSAVASGLFCATEISQPSFLIYGPLILVFFSMIAISIVTLKQGAQLSCTRSSIKIVSDLTRYYTAWMTFRFLILFCTVGFWGAHFVLSETLNLSSSLIIACLILASEIIGRCIHFSLHMTVGTH